jgi:PIN domain nuclease of toxin-antitoxin system
MKSLRISSRAVIRYLLDTHALVWAVTAPNELPARVHEILASGEVTASVISYWELTLKKGRQNTPVLKPAAWWDQYITRAAVEVLPLRVAHVDRLDTLPELHKDPFDRILVAQALAEGLTLATKDAILARYGVPVVWE